MEKGLEKNRTRILELLRSLPLPGEILLSAVGNGLSGFSLRPKSIPKKIFGTSCDLSYTVDLQLMKNEKAFGGDDHLLVLNVRSSEWEQWISQKQPVFVIRAEDVGKEIGVVEEREKNFNRNLLHEFLNQLSLTLTIGKEYRESILHVDGYPDHFWDNSTSVSGNSRSDRMSNIKAKINGIESHPAIEARDTLYLKYWAFLSDESQPFMNTVIKWHKTLIALYHLMKIEDADIPIDFNELKNKCLDEINAAKVAMQVSNS